METQKRRFREKTFKSNFEFMKKFYENLQDREWHSEKDSVRLVVGKDKNRQPITVTIKESLEIPNCAINPRLLERTTGWVERKANTKLGMQIRWVATTPPTNAMMDELTIILDDQKNGKRNREIAEAKLKEQQKKETALVNTVPETVAETVPEENNEDGLTTVGEVINNHLENNFPTTDEIGELFVEGLKGTYGDKFNNLFKQVQEMRKENKEIKKVLDKQYKVFCEIAGVKPE